jgi:hypothetical protein
MDVPRGTSGASSGVGLADKAPTPRIDVGFITSAHPVTGRVLRAVGRAYQAAAEAAIRLGVPSGLFRDHVPFFLLAIAGMILLMPRNLVLSRYAIERALGYSTARPDLTMWPYVPAFLVSALALFVATWTFSPRARLRVLAIGSLALAFVHGYLDARSIVPAAVLLALAFGVVRLPIARIYAAVGTMALSLAALVVGQAFFPETEFARITAFQTALIPMLWYSAYEHEAPRRPLGLGQFLSYLQIRTFGGPVAGYRDLFAPVPPAKLAAIRFEGVKALYVALTASIVAAGTTLVWREFSVETLAGLPLLLFLYVGYIGLYCRLVVIFNLVIGILRLFGIPIRDNFNYWVTARTPNEHWQRWNMLFREWILTFVFFPIMRSRRWLFGAIMGALLMSGLLHVVPEVVTGAGTGFSILISFTYWVINGLAIYAVIRVPQMFPNAVARLGIGNRAWSVAGIVLTSTFYAVLYGLKYCHGWSGVVDYFGRLSNVL